MAVAAQQMDDRARLGIIMMLAAWFLFALVDTGAKWIVIAGIPAIQAAFFRYAGHFAISILAIARGGMDWQRFATPHFWPLALRSGLLISATCLNFYVLRVLPLTVTSAIMFSSPIIVSLLSWPLLGERIGPWRTGAVLVGFAGVMVVIRPFGEAFQWSMLLVVYNATALALYSIFTRKLAGQVATETMQFYMGLLGTVVLLPFAVWAWNWPEDPVQWFVLVSLGVFGWAGHQLLTGAHRFATSGTLMPYTYSFLLYLTVTSFAVFGHVPDLWTMVGAGVIISSGLVIWKRETR
jgi:drug/metabolite transporter (DMT)-like permease